VCLASFLSVVVARIASLHDASLVIASHPDVEAQLGPEVTNSCTRGSVGADVVGADVGTFAHEHRHLREVLHFPIAFDLLLKYTEFPNAQQPFGRVRVYCGASFESVVSSRIAASHSVWSAIAVHPALDAHVPDDDTSLYVVGPVGATVVGAIDGTFSHEHRHLREVLHFPIAFDLLLKYTEFPDAQQPFGRVRVYCEASFESVVSLRIAESHSDCSVIGEHPASEEHQEFVTSLKTLGTVGVPVVGANVGTLVVGT